MLITIFDQIPDRRRAQGRMFDLPHLLFFSVLAILSGADSYRKIHTFMKTHFETLQTVFETNWKRPPAYTTIGFIIRGVDICEMEKAFRGHARTLARLDPKVLKVISMDGKTLRGSFDHFQDKKAMQIFSALFKDKQIILAHEQIIDKKTNEIPVAQKLIKDLGLTNCLFTMDALHCQKKR